MMIDSNQQSWVKTLKLIFCQNLIFFRSFILCGLIIVLKHWLFCSFLPTLNLLLIITFCILHFIFRANALNFVETSWNVKSNEILARSDAPYHIYWVWNKCPTIKVVKCIVRDKVGMKMRVKFCFINQFSPWQWARGKCVVCRPGRTRRSTRPPGGRQLANRCVLSRAAPLAAHTCRARFTVTVLQHPLRKPAKQPQLINIRE